MNAKLSDPRGVPDAEIDAIVKNGKAVVLQSMSMHSTEIGGSQMAVELVYDLLSRNDDEAKRILDNVVAIMIPSFNPDGEIMVTEWYRKTLGTEAEGTAPPWLYQKYAGHDNNRDAFQMNLPDSRYIAKLLFRDWIPQAYVDHHHMGSNGARIFLPPYADPVRPSADPIVWRELAWYGAHMATKEEEYGHVRRHQRRGLFRLGPHGLPLDHALPQHRRHAHGIGERAPRVADDDAEGAAASATRAIFRSTRSRPTSRIRGPAASGICATSSTARKSRRGPRSTSRRETRRWCSATRISRRSIRPSAAKRASRRRSSFRSPSSTIRSRR